MFQSLCLDYKKTGNLTYIVQFTTISRVQICPAELGAPVAQWVKRWPTDPADRVRSQLETKSSRQ